jgi:hydrogenase-4 transcriptional activator
MAEPEPERVIGARGGLRSVLERVAMVAPSDLPVLLLGETGTGKEVIARVIHDGSVRCDGPFWRVNCGALSPELVDSELFGHERGSFTGAIAQRKGWFEQAHRGTLFLDEIAELSPAVQVRLLRVLQEGDLVRVGGTQTIAVDVRIVAATHRDLVAMVEAREFRDDLFYRVSAFPLVIPPLRERSGDIPELARYFAVRAAQRFELRPVAIDAHDLELLLDYSWPGNVRELASVIDRAVLLGEGRRVDIARSLHLSPRAAMSRSAHTDHGPTLATAPAPLPHTAASAPSVPHATTSATPVPHAAPNAPVRIEPLDDVIRRHIEHALSACKGRIDGPFGAAEKLAINPHTLRARMRKLGINWRHHRRT